MNAVGKKIRKLRVSKGLSLEDLAYLSSTCKSYIWELENRPNKKINIEKMKAVAEALGVTAAFLLRLEKPDERDQKVIEDIMKALGQSTMIELGEKT